MTPRPPRLTGANARLLRIWGYDSDQPRSGGPIRAWGVVRESCERNVSPRSTAKIYMSVELISRDPSPFCRDRNEAQSDTVNRRRRAFD